jgi:WD40 repeat protein
MKQDKICALLALLGLASAAAAEDSIDFIWRRAAPDYPSSLSFHYSGSFFVGDGPYCFVIRMGDGSVIRTYGSTFSSCRFGSFSPDGRFLAISSQGQRGSVSFSVLDTETWSWVGGFSVPEDMTNATGVMFSPDSRSLVLCTSHGTYVLDVPSFALRYQTAVSCPMSISPDSQMALVGGSPGPRILNLQDGSDRTPSSGYPGLGPPGVLGNDWVALSGDGGIEIKTLTEPPQEVARIGSSRPRVLVRSPDDGMIAGAFDGGAVGTIVQIWETQAFASIGSWPTGARYTAFRDLAFTRDSQGLAISEGIDDGPVKLWSIPDGTLQQILVSDRGFDSELVFSPDSRLLAGGFGEVGYVRLWQSSDGTTLQTLPGRGRVKTLAFSADGQFLVSGGDNLNVWSLPDGALVQSLAEETLKVAISANGVLAQRLASEVRLRTLPDLALLRSIPQGGPIAFSPDGGRILVGAELFDVDSGSLQRSFPLSSPGDSLYSVEGRSVAFIDPVPGLGGNPVIERFDADSGDLLASFGWLSNEFTGGAEISSLRLSPDGRSLSQISIRYQGLFPPRSYPTLRIWDLDGNLFRTSTDVIGRSLSYSPDARYIAFWPPTGRLQIAGVALNPCAGPSCPPDPVPVANLFENFGSSVLNPALWNTEVSGGRMIVDSPGHGLILQPEPNRGDTRLIATSKRTYALPGSSLTVYVSEVVGRGNVNNSVMLQLDGENLLLWVYEDGVLSALSFVAGERTTHAAVVYARDEHETWRIRESGGSVSFETRNTRGQWTEWSTVAASSLFPLDAVRVVLEAATFDGGSPTPGQARYFRVN